MRTYVSDAADCSNVIAITDGSWSGLVAVILPPNSGGSGGGTLMMTQISLSDWERVAAHTLLVCGIRSNEYASAFRSPRSSEYAGRSFLFPLAKQHVERREDEGQHDEDHANHIDHGAEPETHPRTDLGH